MRRFPAGNPMHPAPGPFAVDLLADWTLHGRATIERLRTWMPQYYVRLASALPPPPSRDGRLAAMSDDELRTALAKTLCELAYSDVLLPGLKLVRTDQA